MTKINLIFNCETADPDDMLTLCMLSHHPKVNLLGVIVVPGSVQQINLVKEILFRLDRLDVLVGAKNPTHPKICVSEFHNKWLGNISTEREYDGLGEDIIDSIVRYNQNVKIISGAALSCIAKYVIKYNTKLNEIIVQGGFAGDSVVPEEYRLDKFKGKETCPTFNLNADIEAAKIIIDTQQIKLKRFVSKNVCHGVIYTQEMHERIKPHRHNNPGLEMMVAGMEFYLSKKPSGKAFHDPLAACVAINLRICKYAEVEIYRTNGEWGSRNIERNSTMSDTFITIAVDKEKFEQVLVGNEI